MKTSKLVNSRKPTPEEIGRGAQIVFERIDSYGVKHTILAAKCHESWEQWGAPSAILSDNVSAVENWRHPSNFQ